MNMVTPRGFRDILPGEAAWREQIEKLVSGAFDSWGYMPIETPTLESTEVLNLGGGVPHEMLRLIDSDGGVLALRPDVTLPIARMVASRLETVFVPLRFRYVQQVFREQETLHAQPREFTQVGIESIGLSGPQGDAEVIALLVSALESCGLPSYTVTIATVDVLNSLLDASSIEGGERAMVLDAYHRSDIVALDAWKASTTVDAVFADAITALPFIRGGREAIEQCMDLVSGLGCSGGLSALLETYDILEGIGMADNVTIDFAVMSSFDYYTGLVMEAYAPGSGISLGSGGRYDSMLSAYGNPAPAAGFALRLDRIMQSLKDQGTTPDTPQPDVLVGGPSAPAVFAFAKSLRASGMSVCIAADADVAAEARARGVARAYLLTDDGSAQDVLGGER